MKKTFFMALLIVGIALFSCQKDLPIEPQNQQEISKENDLTEIVLRAAASGIQTYWGYTSERYLESKKVYRFNSSSSDIGWSPNYDYIVDHIEVTKEITIPDGYTAIVEDTPNAGYLSNAGYKRGISGKMIGSNLVMTTYVYAVRTQCGTGAAVDKYMPKIHINSNNLQELPWNVRIFEKKKLIAHRGFHDNNISDIRENTVGAFIKAQNMKIYGSEIDVWVTKDGVPVIYHDNLFYGKLIVETNYAELKAKEGEIKLPTLGQFLAQAKASNTTRLVLDIKPRPGIYSDEDRDKSSTDIIMDEIKKYGISFLSIDYLSFSKAICQRVTARSGPNASVYLLIDDKNNSNYNISELKKWGINGVSFDYQYLYLAGYFNSTKVQDAKSAGMKVNVWTVNDMKFMGVLLNAGVDYISTDSLAKL